MTCGPLAEVPNVELDIAGLPDVEVRTRDGRSFDVDSFKNMPILKSFDTAQHRCADGYSKDRTTHIESLTFSVNCQSSGTFFPDFTGARFCLPIQCSNSFLPELAYTEVINGSDSFFFGDQVTLNCEEGHTIDGEVGGKTSFKLDCLANLQKLRTAHLADKEALENKFREEQEKEKRSLEELRKAEALVAKEKQSLEELRKSHTADKEVTQKEHAAELQKLRTAHAVEKDAWQKKAAHCEWRHKFAVQCIGLSSVGAWFRPSRDSQLCAHNEGPVLSVFLKICGQIEYPFHHYNRSHALALIIAITVSFAIATGVELVSSFSLHYWI